MTGILETTNSAYAMAKLAGLELIKSYRKEYGRKWISVMPTNLYGPNDNFNLEGSHAFPAFIRKFIEAQKANSKEITLWGTGYPRREFLHVDDLARAIDICINDYDSDLQINIGTGVDLTISELASKIAGAVGFKGQIKWDSSKNDGTPQKLLDISRVIKLGWSPVINLDDGIKSTVEWYKKNK